jgi:hypothetical protein
MRTLIALFLFGVMAARAADETNAAPAQAAEPAPMKATEVVEAKPTNAPTLTGFDAFKVIAQRNIFDPNRRREGGGPVAPVERPKRTDAFTLVGAIAYEKGQFAFFEGSSSEYRKSVKAGDNFAGYKVAQVSPAQVTLEAEGKKVEMPVGSQMRRIEGEEWKMSAHAEPVESRESGSAREVRSESRNESRDRENFRNRERGSRDFNSSGRTGFDSSRNGFDRTSRPSESATTTSRSSSPAPSSSGGGNVDPAEALKRLMERRARGE